MAVNYLMKIINLTNRDKSQLNLRYAKDNYYDIASPKLMKINLLKKEFFLYYSFFSTIVYYLN